MAFPLELASKLSGATPFQLSKWRRTGLLVPEVSHERPPIYSYRDVVALRAMVFLRAKTSSQKLTKAWANLDTIDMVEVADHPSEFKFGSDGSKIFVLAASGDVLDLTFKPGHRLTEFTFEELFEEFENFRGERVINFERPASSLSVHPRTLGGWPVVAGTRVPFDAIAQLVDGESVLLADVPDLFPRVTVEQARDAIAFSESLGAVTAP
jgi:uncharacterized protein (DUF433 family)